MLLEEQNVNEASSLTEFSAPTPIYRAVAERIRARIASGEWQSGDVLPAEVALAQDMRVSVGTIRRALGELTSEGALARRRKTGTIVTGRTPHHNLRFYFDHFRLHSRAGDLQNSTPRVLGVERRTATEKERRPLDLAPGEEIFRITRVRSIGERPVMLDVTCIPVAIAPDMPTAPQDVPHLLYTMLWQRYNVRVTAIREQVEAQLATEEDCLHLGLTPPAAVLVIQAISYNETARPVLISTSRASTAEDIYINEIQ